MGNLRHTPEELRTSAGKTHIIVFLMSQVVLKHYQGQEPLSQRVQKKPQRGIGGMRGKEKLLCPSQPKWLTVKANLLSAEWPGVCGCHVTSLDIRYPVYLSPGVNVPLEICLQGHHPTVTHNSCFHFLEMLFLPPIFLEQWVYIFHEPFTGYICVFPHCGWTWELSQILLFSMRP